MISLLIYNIEMGRQLPKILQWIESLGQLPEIICFQEFPEVQIESFIKSFDHGNYQHQYAPSFQKRHHTYGQLTLYPVSWVNQKQMISLKKSFLIDLGLSTGEKILFRNKGNRSSLITVFTYKRKSFAIANSHLTLLHVNKKRRMQLQIIMEKLEKNLSSSLPQIILGDFNYSSLIRQKKLIQFMEKNQFRNAYKLKTHRILFFHHQLDYVFYKNCTVKDAVVTKLRFSDHYPVQFKLEI